MTATFHLAVHLFLQLAVILIACRLAGRVLRHLGQTQVVSEMVAGVLLGPSLLGLIWPEAQRFLFPTMLIVGGQTIAHPSMVILYALSQVGLVLFLFLIGLELNTALLGQHSKEAVTISLSGILAPAVIGCGLGILLSGDSRLFGAGMASWQAGIFMASAMSITAFPMLARILYEAGLTKTKIGTLTLGAAAINDAAAWALLACVIATVKGSPSIALLAVSGGLLYALLMIFVGRPLFRRFEPDTIRDDGVRTDTLAILLVILAACAWLTDLVGIYSVFGAFIVGAVMPRGRFARDVVDKLEPLTVPLLLPIFFVYSGLNTQMRLLLEPSLFWVAVTVILGAFLCKGGGCLLASKAIGASWREAAGIGVLMNARGMMELILVNIALERGLIRSSLFTILVLMAILTTLAASPLYRLLHVRESQSRESPTPATAGSGE